MKLKKILLLAIAGLSCIAFSSCSKSNGYGSGTPAPGGGNGGGSSTINIYNMAFPATTTVKKGSVVKWYNQDGYTHTVTSDDGTSFDSGNLDAGATFSYTANTVGSFAYHCKIHANMKATLVVTE